MIFYSDNISKDLNSYLFEKNYSKIFILVDENTEKYCLTLLSLNFEYKIIKIKSGEKNKNINTVSFIWEDLLFEKADRASLVINLGGGVISDIGAFAASTYKRGVDFINIPTTLLAMVDATVGGKAGFNFLNKKNMIGLFSKPVAIFIDVKFLLSLDKREFINGVAEVLKHGLLFDLEYFYEVIELLTPSLAPQPPKGGASDWNLAKKFPLGDLGAKTWKAIVKKSIEFKKKIVDEDFDEKGKRKILNLGHTIGHAFESYFLDKNIDLKHGEAVVLGLICILNLSNKKFGFSNELQNRIISDLKKVYSLNMYLNFKNENITKYLIDDKKNKNGKLLMVLLDKDNNPIYDIKITESEIIESLNFLKEIY